MRVLSGKARGLKLNWRANDSLRPTPEKVKESLFNILQFELAGKNFLDLFGGTGQIGIEAASRNAGRVFIVEKNFKCRQIIQSNLYKLKFEHKIELICTDALKYIETFGYEDFFDIVFLDPPFDSEFVITCAQKLVKIVNENGVIIAEIPSGKVFSVEQAVNNTTDFKLKKIYDYGNISLLLFSKMKEGSA